MVEPEHIGPSFPSRMEYSQSQRCPGKCFTPINQHFPTPRHSFRKHFFLQKIPRQLYIERNTSQILRHSRLRRGDLTLGPDDCIRKGFDVQSLLLSPEQENLFCRERKRLLEHISYIQCFSEVSSAFPVRFVHRCIIQTLEISICGVLPTFLC